MSESANKGSDHRDGYQRGRHRPRRAHRFAIEVRVVTVDDVDRDHLVSLLVECATAGLHKILTEIAWVELDGRRAARWDPVSVAGIEAMAPPPDARLLPATRLLERALAEYKRALGVQDEDEPDDESGIVG